MGFFPARLPTVKPRTFPYDGKMQFNLTANIRLARIKKDKDNAATNS
jgi:hypothetical protein